MKTVVKDVIGTGDDVYDDFVASMATQLDGFRAQDELAVEFARRFIGLSAAFIDEGIKRKKLKLT